MIGKTVAIGITLGLDAKRIKATVIEQLFNDEYVVEGEDGNHYLRKIVKDENGNFIASELGY